jgi:hypothetical protein
LMGQPRRTPRCHPRTQGHMHSKAKSSGRLLATSFGGLSYNISTVRTSSMADLPLSSA